METIIVTGGAGFIGGAFVRQTIAEIRKGWKPPKSYRWAWRPATLASRLHSVDPSRGAIRCFFAGQERSATPNFKNITQVRSLGASPSTHGRLTHARMVDAPTYEHEGAD